MELFIVHIKLFVGWLYKLSRITTTGVSHKECRNQTGNASTAESKKRTKRSPYPRPYSETEIWDGESFLQLLSTNLRSAIRLYLVIVGFDARNHEITSLKIGNIPSQRTICRRRNTAQHKDLCEVQYC